MGEGLALVVSVKLGLIDTVTLAVPEHPPLVTVTVYVPALAEVAPGILGVSEVLEKLFGPDQTYEPPEGVAVKFNV